MDNLQASIQEAKDILKTYQNNSPLSYKKHISNKIWRSQFLSGKTFILSLSSVVQFLLVLRFFKTT